MVFSSATFLFYFLPITLGLYYLALNFGLKYANSILLVLSLLFYFWGEREYLILFILSLTINYFIAWLLSKTQKQAHRKFIFITGVFLNLGALGFFKYAGFFADTVCAIFGISKNQEFFHAIRLPLGISFFTFHGLSYLFDIYRGTILFKPGKVNVGLYIALFPQLIAGPIVRYKEISTQLEERTHNKEIFVEGISRFIIGLAKKILIANELGSFADYAFSLSPDRLSTFIAWIGITCYTLQIYFDFSGYSDMAIGLAKMFGFTFPENFKLPYTANSIREFWQRWHITLSNWFRDYLYIPLGGNRQGSLSTTRNLLIVFFLCGLWHGASWNFIIWGILHGSFLTLERGKFGEVLERCNQSIQHFYVLAVVMLLWVPFRAETLQASFIYWKALFGFPLTHSLDPYLIIHLKNQTILTFVLGLFFASGLHLKLYKIFSSSALFWIKPLVGAALFLFSLSEIAAGSYSPFIYFRF